MVFPITEGKHPLRSSSTTPIPDALWDALEGCWQFVPADRPNAHDLFLRLKAGLPCEEMQLPDSPSIPPASGDAEWFIGVGESASTGTSQRTTDVTSVQQPDLADTPHDPPTSSSLSAIAIDATSLEPPESVLVPGMAPPPNVAQSFWDSFRNLNIRGAFGLL